MMRQVGGHHWGLVLAQFSCPGSDCPPVPPLMCSGPANVLQAAQFMGARIWVPHDLFMGLRALPMLLLMFKDLLENYDTGFGERFQGQHPTPCAIHMHRGSEQSSYCRSPARKVPNLNIQEVPWAGRLLTSMELKEFKCWSTLGNPGFAVRGGR